MARGATTTTRLHKNFYYLPSFKDTQFFRGENVKAFLLQQLVEWWQPWSNLLRNVFCVCQEVQDGITLWFTAD